MKKTWKIGGAAGAIAFALIVGAGMAADPDSTFRETQRTTIQEYTWGDAVSMPGTLAVVGNISAASYTVTAGAGIDAASAGTLALGAATATKVEVSDTGVTCEVQGPLVAKEDIAADEIDAETATALLIGKATATSVTIGAADITTSIAGAFTAPVTTAVTDATDTRVCTSADYGKIVVLTHADTVAVTLPANGAAAGSWIDFMLAGDDNLAVTIASATADTLITANSADSDSVTFGSGHRIGAYVRCISNGSFWVALNMGQTTMTVNDSD